MRRFLALAVLSVTLPALGADYPTKPDEMDKLCEVIGEAPNLSIPPKDRLWFKESCICREVVGCGRAGSTRWLTRVEAVAIVERRRLEAEAAEQEAVQRAARAQHAELLKQMRVDCKALEDCLRANVGKPKACKEAASTFEYKCSSTLRDVDACGDAIKALVAQPTTASCATVLK